MRRINGCQAHYHCDQHIHLLLLFGSKEFTISENLIIYLARVRLKTLDQSRNDSLVYWVYYHVSQVTYYFLNHSH